MKKKVSENSSIEDYIANNMSYEGVGDFFKSICKEVSDYEQTPTNIMQGKRDLALHAMSKGYDYVTSVKVIVENSIFYAYGTGLKHKSSEYKI